MSHDSPGWMILRHRGHIAKPASTCGAHVRLSLVIREPVILSAMRVSVLQFLDLGLSLRTYRSALQRGWRTHMPEEEGAGTLSPEVVRDSVFAVPSEPVAVYVRAGVRIGHAAGPGCAHGSQLRALLSVCISGPPRPCLSGPAFTRVPMSSERAPLVAGARL